MLIAFLLVSSYSLLFSVNVFISPRRPRKVSNEGFADASLNTWVLTKYFKISFIAQ